MDQPQPRSAAPRKRVRKRRRRVPSDSPSSSSNISSSSSSESSQKESDQDSNEKGTVTPKTRKQSTLSSSSSSPSSPSPSSESSESSESESDPGHDGASVAFAPKSLKKPQPGTSLTSNPPQNHDPGHIPSNFQPSFALPSFLPRPGSSIQDATSRDEEQSLRDRFRKFWMSSMADGFKDDLEEIRKEPNLGQSRLALLIDSLASGANVFSSSSENGQVNEVEAAIGNS